MLWPALFLGVACIPVQDVRPPGPGANEPAPAASEAPADPEVTVLWDVPNPGFFGQTVGAVVVHGPSGELVDWRELERHQPLTISIVADGMITIIGDAGPITIVEPQPGDVIPYVAEPRLPFVDYDTLSVDIDPVAVFDGATEYVILVLCDGAPDTGYTGWRRGISDGIDVPFTGDSINVPVACAGPDASFTVVGQALDGTDRVVAVSAAEGLTVSSKPLTLPAWEVDPGAEITLHLEQTPEPETIRLNATRGAQPAGWSAPSSSRQRVTHRPTPSAGLRPGHG